MNEAVRDHWLIAVAGVVLVIAALIWWRGRLAALIPPAGGRQDAQHRDHRDTTQRRELAVVYDLSDLITLAELEHGSAPKPKFGGLRTFEDGREWLMRSARRAVEQA